MRGATTLWTHLTLKICPTTAINQIKALLLFCGNSNHNIDAIDAYKYAQSGQCTK